MVEKAYLILRRKEFVFEVFDPIGGSVKITASSSVDRKSMTAETISEAYPRGHDYAVPMSLRKDLGRRKNPHQFLRNKAELIRGRRRSASRLPSSRWMTTV